MARRGIGPAYEDKVGRRAIRLCDLAHLDDLDAQLDRLTAHHDALRAGFGEPPIDRARLLGELREIAPFVLPFAQPAWRVLGDRSEEHTSELQSLMRISYAVFCLKKKNKK